MPLTYNYMDLDRRQPDGGNTSKPAPSPYKTVPGATMPTTVSDPWGDAVKAFQDTMTAVADPGGNAGADKAQALKDIDIARRELNFQQDTGLRDVEQDRTLGLQKVDRNALQRGIYRSGIRSTNRDLMNRESDEAASDLRQQIAFALERLANREANVNAGGSSGGGMGGGSGIDPGAMLDIFSRFMGMGSQYGWLTQPVVGPAQGRYTPDRVYGTAPTGTNVSGTR